MGYLRVRTYSKQDGTVVRGHQRRNPFSRIFSRSKPDKRNLEMLVDGPPVYPKQKDLEEQQLDIGNGGWYTMFGQELSPAVAGSAVAGVTTGIFAGITGAFFPIGTAIIAAGFAPFLIKKIPEYLRVRKARKQMRSLNTASEATAPEEEKLKSYLQTTGWKTEPFESNIKDEHSSYTYTVSPEGLGVVEGKDTFWATGQKFVVPRKLYFYPGVDVSKTDFGFPLILPGVNLEGANFESVYLSTANLDGANLDGTNWANSRLMLRGWDNTSPANRLSFKNASLRGADLTNAHFQLCDMSGANLTGAKLKGAILPRDLTNIRITNEQFEELTADGMSLDEPYRYEYPKRTFQEAIEELGLDESKFEYLVLSKVIRIRNNKTNRIVTSNFDPEKHHVPVWEIEAAKKALAA